MSERVITYGEEDRGFIFAPGSVKTSDKPIPVTINFDRRNIVGAATLKTDDLGVLADIALTEEDYESLRSQVDWSIGFQIDEAVLETDPTEVTMARILELAGLPKGETVQPRG